MIGVFILEREKEKEKGTSFRNTGEGRLPPITAKACEEKTKARRREKQKKKEKRVLRPVFWGGGAESTIPL